MTSNYSKKKRRRIKQVDDSDLSGSGSEAEGRRHGRKNIRKVMGKGQLEEATIKAAREERGRLARIAERQKLVRNSSNYIGRFSKLKFIINKNPPCVLLSSLGFIYFPKGPFQTRHLIS